MPNFSIQADSKSNCGEKLEKVVKFKFEDAMRVRSLIDKNGLYWSVENLGLIDYWLAMLRSMEVKFI
jgi:hypothetical protein